MNDRPSLPRWQMLAFSLVILFHLVAIGASSLSADSGPWPVDEGVDWATPPQFAGLIVRGESWNIRPYLSLLKMTHNYHFISNRPEPVTRFEARLLDAEGNETRTLQFPDANANSIVRNYQQLLAEGLAEDELIEPPAGEFIPAPNQPVRTVRIWEIDENGPGKISTVEEHLIPRDQPIYGPSEWSLLLARSFSRDLCRAHGVASVELVRSIKDYIPPGVMFMDGVPAPDAFDAGRVSFGVIHAQQ